MIFKCLSLIFAASFVCSGLILANPPEGIFPYKYHEEILSNGFKIIVIPMESPGLVAYYSVVRTGSRDEYEPGHSGFAHFFEHMMFRGTEKYPSHIYDKHMTEMGADANAYTSDDITCYHLNVSSEDLKMFMELESDRFLNLSYNERGFKTEAGAVHGEYLQSLSSPFFALREKLLNTAFDKHTYKHTTIGFKEDVEAMPTMYEYSKTFFNRYYRPENVVLLIVRDVNPTSTIDLAKKYYGPWEKGYVPPKITREPKQKAERSANLKFDGKSLPILSINYKSLAFDPQSTEMAACMLMGDLMFGRTSDINKKLVLDEQRVQFIGANFYSARDPKLLSIVTMVKKENDIDNVENEIYETIDHYQKNLVDEKRLNDLKSNLRYGFLMGLSTPDRVAGRLTRTIAITGGIEAIDQLYNSIDRITREDILSAANKFLVKEKRTVVVLKGR